MARSALALQRRGRAINRAQKAEPLPYPSPTGGWNTRDALSAMDPTDAVVLDNWFPGLGSCKTRAGATAYATGLGGTARTLAEFNAGGLRKFIAAANNTIWNISSSGAGASLASGFTNDVWDWAQFDDASGGARMGLVNGADAPRLYDGAAVSAMTISGTGLTIANLNGICIHRSRSYFWDDRTQDFWYSATNALGGAMTKFPLGRVNGTGGNLMCMVTWSRDSGTGLDDLAAFILTSGDMLIYAGTNPGDANAWQLVGRYVVAAPISKRAIKKVGADVIVTTKAGYVSLAQVFQRGRFDEESGAISSKIRQSVLDTTAAQPSTFGWQIQHYPKGNYVAVNVPTSASTFVQHVWNTETKAWCRFTGQTAYCWGLFNDALYYGKSDGTVVLADSGTADLSAPIVNNAQPAWNVLGNPGSTKRVTAIRFSLRRTAATLSYLAGMAFDFKQLLTSVNQNISDTSGATWLTWESNPWDTQPWGIGDLISNQWCSASGCGYFVGTSLQLTLSTQRVEWLATTYLSESGGTI
jgi:hypothetical protein